MVEVFPVRTPTVPPATHTNCYRVGGVVVDPASPYDAEQQALAGALGGRVDLILVTHHHPDHVGGVEDLRRRTGAPVWAHRDARLPFPVDATIDDEQRIDTGAGTLRAVHTPGHADGHLVFLVEETGDLVAGDLVAGIGTILLAPPEGHLRTYLASLERMVSRVRRLFPAHGPAIDDGPALLREYVAHRHARTAQVVRALEGGPADAVGLARIVYAGIPGVDLRLAAAQVGAHAEWLVEAGRARATEDGRWALGESA